MATSDRRYQDGPAHGKGAAAFISAVRWTYTNNDEYAYLIPFNSQYISQLNYDPGNLSTITYQDLVYHAQGTNAFSGGYMYNNELGLIPYSAPNFMKWGGKFDPTLYTGYPNPYGAGAYAGGFQYGNEAWVIPYNAPTIGKANYGNLFSEYVYSGKHGKGLKAFSGAWTSQAGSCAFVPFNSPDILYHSAGEPSGGFTNWGTHGCGQQAFSGAIMSNVPGYSGAGIFIPFDSPNIYIRGLSNPIGPAHGKGSGAFAGGVLMADGRIALVPFNSPCIGIYNPANNTYEDGPAHGKGPGAFVNGFRFGTSSKIGLVPFNSPNVGIFDPTL